MNDRSFGKTVASRPSLFGLVERALRSIARQPAPPADPDPNALYRAIYPDPSTVIIETKRSRP